MVKKLRIYLAHSVHERPQGLEIQKKLESLGLEVFNPFYPNKEPRKDIIDIDKGNIVAWDLHSKNQGEKIIKGDLAVIDKVDMIVAILPEGSTIGIPCELMYAYLKKIPIYTVTKMYRGHPWILGLSDKVFGNFEEFVYWWITMRKDKCSHVGKYNRECEGCYDFIGDCTPNV